MVALTTVVALYNIAAHEHDHGVPTGASYIKIRTKPYPWKCSDCNLFDGECQKACAESA